MRSLVIIALGALAFSGSVAGNAGEPTCSHFGTATHGQHIVGDYVTGIGSGGVVPGLPSGDIGWPPDGSEVGAAVSGNGGAYTPGGPGPGFHFENGVAPGASACLDAASPGMHFPPPE